MNQAPTLKRAGKVLTRSAECMFFAFFHISKWQPAIMVMKAIPKGPFLKYFISYIMFQFF